MQEHKKLAVITQFPNEDAFRENLIIPLFRKMEFTRVLDNQAVNENGIDVVLEHKDELERNVHTGVLLKVDDVTAKAGKKTSLVRTIEEQVIQAIKSPITHPDIPNATFATRIWLITKGKATRNARDLLNKMYRECGGVGDFVVLDNRDLIGIIDRYWPEFYDDQRPFLSQYGKRLLTELSSISIPTVETSESKRLEDIYIEPLIRPVTNKSDIDQISLEKKNQLIHSDSLLNSKENYVFILGGAGSGKSTFLKRFAYLACQDGSSVPVILHAKTVLEHIDDFEGLLLSSLKSYGFDSSVSLVEEFGGSKITLLVDGLDELSDVREKSLVTSELQNFIETIDLPLRVIVASRPESSISSLKEFSKHYVFELTPLHMRQVEGFFKRWLGNDARAKKLMQALEDKALLERIPKTPMTMTLLAIVYRSKEDIPSTITDLYHMFTDLLLGKWDESKGVRAVVDAKVKSSFLESLAWNMHSDGEEDVSKENLFYEAQEFIGVRVGENNYSARDLCEELLNRSGLLVVDKSGKVRFSHLSFQEYFASRYAFRNRKVDECFSEWFGHPWWSQVLYFTAGQMEDLTRLSNAGISMTAEAGDLMFEKIITLGAMLQAAYLTPKPVKKDILNASAGSLHEVYLGMESMLATVKHNIPRFGVLGVMDFYFSANYSSRFIDDAILEILEDQLYDLNFDNQADVFSAFFLASTLAKNGKTYFLESLATDPKFLDASLMILSEARLEEVNNKLGKTEKKVFKKLEKKIKGMIPTVRAELQKPLPSGEKETL